MDHNWILQIAISFLVSGASAIGGVRYAIRTIEKRLDHQDTSISKIQCDLATKYATIDVCRDTKAGCKSDKIIATKEITDKIDRLSVDIIEQNRRREDAKDDNQRLYAEINAKLARLEARLEGILEK